MFAGGGAKIIVTPLVTAVADPEVRARSGGCAPSGCVGAESPLGSEGEVPPVAAVLVHSV